MQHFGTEQRSSQFGVRSKNVCPRSHIYLQNNWAATEPILAFGAAICGRPEFDVSPNSLWPFPRALSSSCKPTFIGIEECHHNTHSGRDSADASPFLGAHFLCTQYPRFLMRFNCLHPHLDTIYRSRLIHCETGIFSLVGICYITECLIKCSDKKLHSK